MKNLYMRRWILLAALIVGFGSGHLSSGQSVSVPYEKSSASGWKTLRVNANKKGNWNVDGSGLTVAAFNDAGNSVNRNSQHWAFSPVIDLKAVSNFLVFSDKREGNTGSTFSVLVGPATADTVRSQYVTVQKWTGTESREVVHKIDLSPWNSEEQIRIAFLRENEAGASWNITGLKVLGSDVSEVDNFRVTAITDDAISLNWAMGSAQTDLQYLLVGSSNGDINWAPTHGVNYPVGTNVSDGVTVLFNGNEAGFIEQGLGEFTSRYYKLWVYNNDLEYSLNGQTASATTIGQSTIFYEDFEGTVSHGRNLVWDSGKNIWNIESHNIDWSDNWLLNGERTSFRGERSAYIVQQGQVEPNYNGGNTDHLLHASFYTNIDVPDTYKSAELSFYWKAGGQQGYDFGRVYVNNVPVRTELYGQTYWKQEVVDLSDFIGQTITLKFEWRNTDAYTGVNLPSFAVDEVLVTGKSVAKPELFRATVVNSSLVALDWEKNSDGNRVLVAYSSSGAFGSLNDGTSYEVGEQIPGGGEVIYKGDAERFEHAIASGNKAYYRIWSLSDGDANTYSTALTASTVLPASLPFFDGFEEGFVWNAIAYKENNWYRGRAEAFSGDYSAYVSSNGGFTTNFTSYWDEDATILELPVNLVGFESVDLNFLYKIEGPDHNNRKAYVRLERGVDSHQFNPVGLTDKPSWTMAEYTTDNGNVFGSASVLRFYMYGNANANNLGFTIDNVGISGVLKPVISAQAANYGGLKNYINWENVEDDASLEVVVLAFTSAPSGNKSLVSGEAYSVGDLVDGGRVVYVGGGEEFVHEPVLGGEEYVYQVYQKNGMTYSDGKTTTAVATPENVVFYEDFETESAWNISGGTGNTWEIGYPSNDGNGTRVAFVTTNSPAPGYAGHKHSDSFVVSMVKTFTFPRLQSDVELSFDYRVETGSSEQGNTWNYDNALVTLSGDVNHSTGKLVNNSAWQTYTSPLTLTGTGETATITMTVALEVNTELVGQLGFLIDNISVTGAYDRNSKVSGTQGASTHDFSSLITSESVSIEPFRFSIVDKGGDGQPTYIHQLEVGTGNDNNVPDWNEAMGGANLYKINADNSLEFIGSGIILSQSILFEKENLIVVPEGGSSIYVIKPWLKETLNSALDNKTLSFKIESAGIVASNGSSFKAVSSSAQSDKYIIRIIATELRFAQEPSLTTNKNIALPRQPIIIATDANGNIDSDFSGSVSVVSDPVGVDGSLSVNAVNGTASFANLKFADSGYYTLAFSSNNLTGVASSEIEVSNYEGINLSGASYIGAVRFAGIDSYTSRGANGYELLTDQVAYLTTGLSYDIQVLFNVASGDGSLDLKAQIDYKDGRGFVDLVSFGSFSDGSNRVEKQTVTAPSNISGRFRLRIILTSGNKGEIEDYTVVISEGQWTGLAPQWDIRDNWTSGRIPSYTDDVTIPSKPTIGVFFPVINDNRDVNNVTIEKDARLTIKPGAKVTIHGDLKVEKPGGLVLENKAGHNGLASLITKGNVSGEANIKLTLPRDEWYYVSHPIKNAKSGIYDVFMPGEDLVNNDFKEFSHIAFHRNNKWYRVTGANVVLWNLEGMSVKYWPTNKSTHTLDYYGVLNNEPISRTYDKAGFYLFGNPYTSSIDWEAAQGWERPNIDGTIWYRTRINKAMAFVTYNREAAEGAKVTIYPDGMTDSDEKRLALIPPMQSVWIKANAPTTLTVDNRIRQHDTKELMLKSSSVASNADVIRITAENQYSRDVAVLYFWEKSHDTLDRGDSEKQFNEGDLVPEVYTLVEGKALAINGLSSLNSNSTSIPISVKNQIAGEVTLSFDLSKFSREYALYLEDKVTGNHSNLLLDNNYTYIVTKTGAVNDRFVLHLHKITTGIEDVILDQGDDASKLISIRSLSDKVLVSVSAELVQTEHGVIEVYAIDGRKISEIPAVSSRTFLILPQEKGVYIVRAIFGKHIKSERVINSQR